MTEGTSKSEPTPVYDETVEAVGADPGTDATLTDKVAPDAEPTESAPVMTAPDDDRRDG